MQNYASIIAQELNIRPQQTEAVIRLLDEDATVPFIARYRKEATGSLDEVAVTAIRDRLAALKELDKRREAILASLEERGLLTPELRAKVEAADALTVLEDIYLPYRPKRRIRIRHALFGVDIGGGHRFGEGAILTGQLIGQRFEAALLRH